MQCVEMEKVDMVYLENILLLVYGQWLQRYDSEECGNGS